MNLEQARVNMIEQQIRTWEVLDKAVLKTLVAVRREAFVPSEYQALVFVDTEIPLPGGENMLSPKLEARLLQEAAVHDTDAVLEIGTGSGYMAALLAHHARHVTSVEILPELKALAEKNLSDYGVANVNVELGNGAQGWSGSGTRAAPWDVIVISGALPVLPRVFLEQLSMGGRLLGIIGEAPVMSACLFTRTAQEAWSETKLFETCITPLRHALAPAAFHF
ncbi:MAG: protein-L-isoaspartate O-methyltransferase family protein [Oxalobacteraceae bacterium]